MDDLILVDIFDNKIGTLDKASAHAKPILHRAFSVFLYNGNKMLVQKRAKGKYHSGGLIANTCCSHPRTDDILGDAATRLKFEVGIKVKAIDLKELFSFTYITKFNENMYEYEYDHVIVGKYDGEYKINEDEVGELKWIDIDKLALDMVKNPQKYASWFLICAPKVIEYIKKNK